MRRRGKPTALAAPTAAVLSLLAALLAPAPAAAQVTQQEGLNFLDTGPLRIRDQFLLGMGFLALEPGSAEVLDRGRWQLDVAFTATNTWVHSASVQRALEERQERAPMTLGDLRSINPGEAIYFADGEVYRTSLALRRGIGKGVQLQIFVPLLNFQGGFGDSLIEEFHDTFGFSQSGRLGVPRDRYTAYIRDRDGNEVFRDRDPGGGVGDLILGAKGRIPTGSGEWKVALEGLVKISTGDEADLYSSGAEDLGLQVLATRYFARSCIHVSFGAVRPGSADTFATGEQTLLATMIGYERALTAASSVIAQLNVSQSPFQDLDIQGLDEVALLIDVGYKKGLDANSVLFLAITENFSNFGSSFDFGLHFGYTYTR